MKIYLLVLALVALCSEVAGNASKMVSGSKCSKPMTVGTTIMGSNLVRTTDRTVLISRSGASVFPFTAYTPGETLTVTLSSIAGEYVFETTGATFSGGGCSATRIVASSATLQMPAAGGGAVTVRAAWALGYGAATVTPDFILTEATAAPTVAPTAAPTASNAPPSTPSPTIVPAPTVPPTAQPTVYTAQMTVVTLTTKQLLSNITATVLIDPAARAALEDSLAESMGSQAPQSVRITSYSTQVEAEVEEGADVGAGRRQLAALPTLLISYDTVYILEQSSYYVVGELQAGVVAVLRLVMDSSLFLSTLRAKGVAQLSDVSGSAFSSVSMTVNVIQQGPLPTDDVASDDDAYAGDAKVKTIIGVVVGVVGVAVVATLLYCASMEEIHGVVKVLARVPAVAAWVLGVVAVGLVAAWATKNDTDNGFLGVPSKSNKLALHVVFMVLFFFAQVQAVCNWSFFSDHLTAKTAHVIAQICALVLMILGLISVVKSTNSTNAPALSSMHSWVGVAATALFCANFLWGSSMRFAPAKLKILFNVWAHRIIGVCALALTVVAINSGIMDKLPLGTCFYELSTSAQDNDPAENYHLLPESCRIAHGLGVAVIASGICAGVAILARSKEAVVGQGQEERVVGVLGQVEGKQREGQVQEVRDSGKWDVSFDDIYDAEGDVMMEKSEGAGDKEIEEIDDAVLKV